MNSHEHRLIIDQESGDVYQESVSRQKVFIFTEELTKNLETFQLYRIDDFNWGATIYQGTNPTGVVSVHYAPTLRIKGRFILNEAGDHVTAIVENSQRGDYNPLTGLFLTEFNDVEIQYKPLFVVDKVNTRTRSLDPNVERCTMYFVGRKPDGSLRIVKPPLANIHNDSKICMGSTILYPPNPSPYKKAEICSYHFQSSETNADLIPTPEKYRAYVRFNLDEKHVPAPDALKNGVSNVGPHKHLVQVITEIFNRRDL